MYIPSAFSEPDLPQLHQQIHNTRLATLVTFGKQGKPATCHHCSIPSKALMAGKRKLSQNRSTADITGVREGLAASPDPHDQALAHLMR